MKSTAKTVGFVMVIMMFSRLLAMAGNQIYIIFFGINLETDIYSYATQLPNIIFNSFGTALATVVIPIFAGYIAKNDQKKAFRFADNVISMAVVFTIALTILGILLAPVFVHFTRFKTEGTDLAVTALRIMFPVMIFYALNYIFQGILQSLGRFNMPALVSIPSSLILITYVLMLRHQFGIIGLAVATLTGLSMQAFILLPPVFKTGYRFRPSFQLRDEDVKNAFRLIPPVLLGTSAYQVNMLFNVSIAANFKDTIAIITFVQNLILYAVLAFIYSITAVIFPKLTMLASTNDMEGFKACLLKVLKTIVYFLVPAAAGFVAVRYELINLLYGWGKVTPANVKTAGMMMALYAIGVTGVGIKEVVDRAFYSLKDTTRPAINGVVIMVVNVALSLVLVSTVGVFGIPAAYSISALVSAMLLVFLIRRKIGNFGGKSLLFLTFKILIASGIMLLAVIPLGMFLKQWDFGNILLDKTIKLLVPVLTGVLIYYTATLFLRIPQSIDVLDKIKGKLNLQKN